MSQVFCDLRSQKTPRGILPVNSNEFFYRLGLKDGLNLKNTVKSVLEMIS